MKELAAAAAAAGGIFLLRSEYEKNQLSVDRYLIHSPKVKGSGKTFVFLTDLHGKEFGEGNRRLLSAIRRENPDAILVGGDSVLAKGKGELGTALRLIEALAADFPVFCANGNHEDRMAREAHIYGTRYLEYRRALKECGAVYLADDFADFGEDFRIYGLNIPAQCYKGRSPKFPEDLLETKLGAAAEERFSILLAHSPMFFREYADWGADLTLSGHFHGGTIRLPIFGGVMTPQYQFFYPWCAGLVREQDHQMIIGRGLGTHSINIRFNNKPQVVVVRVEK